MKKKNIFLSFGAFIVYSLCIFLLLTAFAMNKLNAYLEEYEKYQPSQISDEVLVFFEAKDAVALSKIPAPGESLEENILSAYLDEVIDTETLFAYKSSATDTQIFYDYISGNKRIATLTVRKSEEKSPRGFDIYAAESILWYPIFTYTVTAPSDCTVYINSKPLEILPETVSVCSEYMDFDGTSTSYVKYTIDYFEYVTDIRAQGVYSDLCILTDDGRGNYVFTYTVPEETMAEVSARTTEAVKAYVYFTTLHSTPVSTVLPYVHKDAPLYSHLKMFDNTWSYYKLSDEFEKFEISDFKFYSDTKVSCRVSAVYVIYQYGGKSLSFDFDFDLYFVNDGGVWYITSMERVIK